jgi:hypothetical protein
MAVRSGGLAKTIQDDFSAGIFRATARHLIDRRGAYDLINLLLDDDGSAYKRGGSAYKSNAAAGTGLRFLWDGFLVGGQRTVFASAAKFWVLDVDDATPIDLAGGGLANPTRAVVVGGVLFIGGGTLYAGSRKAADYSTGTVAVTNASKVVTGTGTTWTTNVDVGMLLRVNATGAYYAVASVDSNTQVTLVDTYQGPTASGQGYALTRLGSTTTAGVYRTSNVYATIADRLISVEGDHVYFSAGRNQTTGQTQPASFAATDFHLLAQGAQGLGAEAVRDQMLVFASNGLWVITNMAFNLTDASGNSQQRLQKISSDIVLWSQEGIAGWDNALVVPCVNGVWRIDGVSSPVRLTNSITPLYIGYVRSGYKTGIGVVYRNHYALPILDASNALVDFLVCRLDRPIETRVGEVWPWTRLAGHAAQSAGMVVRVGSSPRTPSLLSAGLTSASRVTDLSGVFEPVAANKNDADASTPAWQIITRDYPTGQGNPNMTIKARVRYELVDAATDDPTIQTYYSIGSFAATSGSYWGAAFWGSGTWSGAIETEFSQLPGTAPEDDGRNPFTWLVQKRSRYIRYRIQSSQPAARMTLRSLEMWNRQSVKDK